MTSTTSPPHQSAQSHEDTRRASAVENSRQSIRFSSPPSPKANSSGFQTDRPGGGSGAQIGESSADEITPIISHQRNHRRYDGSPPNPPSSTDPPTGSRNSSSTSLSRKRRKSTRMRNDLTGEEHDQHEPEPHNSRLTVWLRDVVDKYGSVELENKGSVARDHLALERTFLAWLRTSLAFASIGIAITQLFRLNTTIGQREGYKPVNPPNTYHLRQVGKPLGATFLGIAIVVLLVGGRRYFESQYWIIRGKFPASRGSVFFITFIAAALIVASLVLVCVVDPSVFEKRR